MLSVLLGSANGLVYVFVIMNTILLFCDISLRHTYQILIVMGAFMFIKQII